MKEIGVVTLLSVVAVAAAPSARSEHSTVFVTERSAQAFGACFAATRAGNPADLLVTDRGARREIQLRSAIVDGPEVQGVKQCI
jgi:cytosine/adenosine deaminase-related metal-dependent hydrolase